MTTAEVKGYFYRLWLEYYALTESFDWEMFGPGGMPKDPTQHRTSNRYATHIRHRVFGGLEHEANQCRDTKWAALNAVEKIFPPMRGRP